MRRPMRLQFLSIGLLAVLLQVLAPGWAAMAMAMQFDPLAGVAICSVHTPDGGPADNGSGSGKHHHVVCPLCHMAASAQPAMLADIVELPLPGLGLPVRHPHVDLAAPRGPPTLAANARAPPTLS
jgi:hypothetical protein